MHSLAKVMATKCTVYFRLAFGFPRCYEVHTFMLQCVLCTLASKQYLNWQIQVSTFDLFFRPILQCGVALVEKPLLDSLGIIVCGTIIKH